VVEHLNVLRSPVAAVLRVADLIADLMRLVRSAWCRWAAPVGTPFYGSADAGPASA